MNTTRRFRVGGYYKQTSGTGSLKWKIRVRQFTSPSDLCVGMTYTEPWTTRLLATSANGSVPNWTQFAAGNTSIYLGPNADVLISVYNSSGTAFLDNISAGFIP